MQPAGEVEDHGRRETGGREVGGRRRWSAEEKLRIVEESFTGLRAGCATARRYGISEQLLWTWRKAKREGRLGGVAGFVAVKVEDAGAAASAGRMEIVIANGRRVIVDSGVDVAAVVGLVHGLENLR